METIQGNPQQQQQNSMKERRRQLMKHQQQQNRNQQQGRSQPQNRGQQPTSSAASASLGTDPQQQQHATANPQYSPNSSFVPRPPLDGSAAAVNMFHPSNFIHPHHHPHHN